MIGWIGQAGRPEVIEVKTTRLNASFVAETISCSGKVEASAHQEVIVEDACVIDRVLIQNGTVVEQGTPLFTVDREATLAVLAQTDGALAVKTAMEDASPTVITAPMTGRVTQMYLKSGDTAQKDSVCAVMEESEPVQIRLSIPERSIRRVSVGQRVVISGVGFQKEQYLGTVREIASVAKEQMNGTGIETTVEAVVSLDEGQADDSLRLGLSAKAAITVESVADGFVIPYSAVLEDEENREYVYVLADGRARKKVFSPKAELRDGYLATDGFMDGEELIVNPEQVTEDTDVTVKREES